MVVTPITGTERVPQPLRCTLAMRLPCTSTSPLKGCSPEPSKMRTLVNNTSDMATSSCRAGLSALGRQELSRSSLARSPAAARSATPWPQRRQDHRCARPWRLVRRSAIARTCIRRRDAVLRHL
jgi:hypothetical protein